MERLTVSLFDVQSSVMRDVNVYMYPRDISLILTIVYSLELNLNYFLRAFWLNNFLSYSLNSIRQ